MIISVNSVEQTTNLGMELGKILNAGDIICLTGDLGTGKTHITKGIAKGLGITDYITSPTFTIVNEYDSGRLKLNHFDIYRVLDFLHIYIEKDLEKGEDYRKITITPYGERYDYIKELKI